MNVDLNLHPLRRRALADVDLPPPFLRDRVLSDAADHISNINPYGGKYSRYPPAVPLQVQHRYAEIVRSYARAHGMPIDANALSANHVLFTDGSISAIELLVRAFCEPLVDHIVVTYPTFIFYARAARCNDVGVKTVSLRGADLNVLTPDSVAGSGPKLAFFCRPNNPVGTLIDLSVIERTAEMMTNGLVVVDEAYIEFCVQESAVALLAHYRNLVIVRTFSKAWGLAGARIGAVLADPIILNTLRLIQVTYAVGTPALQLLDDAFQHPERMSSDCARICESRERMSADLASLSIVRRVYPSAANFILVELTSSAGLRALVDGSVAVADTGKDVPGTIRVSVGAPESNERLLSLLRAASVQE